MERGATLTKKAGLIVAMMLVSVITSAAEERDPVAPGFFAEPTPIARVIELYERRAPQPGTLREGFFIDFDNMITGSGWISAGPGYRRRVWQRRAIVTTSAALSWRLYSAAQARIELPDLSRGRLLIGAETKYRDSLQVNYFGLGNNSSPQDRSGFRLRTGDVVGYVSWRAKNVVISARAGRLAYVDASSMRGRTPAYPDTERLFNERTAPGLSQQPAFLHADLSVVADTRDAVADPSSGGVYRASAARFADRDSGKFSFSLYELEAAHYYAVVPDRIVVGAHAWGAFAVAEPGREVPFFLMPNVGGKNTIRGLPDFRFYDRAMDTFSAEVRFRVFTHVQAALFADTGRVAPRARELGLSGMHSSVGVGVRLHNRRTTLGRLDIAKGNEGWHLVFRMNEPFRRKTLDGNRSAVGPFVP